MAWYDYDYPYLAKVFAELVRRRNALTTQDGTLSQYNFTTLGTNPSDDALVGASLGGKNPTNFIRDFFAEMKIATDVSRPTDEIYYNCDVYNYSWKFATPIPTVPAEIDPNDWDTWVGHCRTTIDSFSESLSYSYDLPATYNYSISLGNLLTTNEVKATGTYGGTDPLSGGLVNITTTERQYHTGYYSGNLHDLGNDSVSWGFVHMDTDSGSSLPGWGPRNYTLLGGLYTWNDTDAAGVGGPNDRYGWFLNGGISGEFSLGPSDWSEMVFDNNRHSAYYTYEAQLSMQIGLAMADWSYNAITHLPSVSYVYGAGVQPWADVPISGSIGPVSVSGTGGTAFGDTTQFSSGYVTVPGSGTIPTTSFSLSVSVRPTSTANLKRDRLSNAYLSNSFYVRSTRTSCPVDFTVVPD